MNRSLRGYRGVWQALDKVCALQNSQAHADTDAEPRVMPFVEIVARTREPAVEPPLVANEWSPSLQQRQALGRQLLEKSPFPGKNPAWVLCLRFGLGQSWSEWAHQRVFSLACVSQVEIPEYVLRRLRQPLSWFWYRKTSLALVKMLSFYAPDVSPRLSSLRLCPPLFIWFFERQLEQALKKKASL